ncbi:hypothetical protein [uncultured Parasutterella sp.]|uniref:hypothetical protein n=1 Tax=uncultured Parasutterella sp. TaxID=1263098 RepID=UPI00260C2A32|nr:hypothetical protein [uncultured Parasutterella sp.]
MNKLSKVFLLVPMFLLVAGCAQTWEGYYSMIDGKAPENAPPGYFSFKRGMASEQRDDYISAARQYCDAAKLGHPQAKRKCVKYVAKSACYGKGSGICRASEFDEDAKRICQDYVNKIDQSCQLYESIHKEDERRLVIQQAVQQREALEKAELEEKKRQEALAKKAHEEALSKISNSSSLESEEF